MEKSDFSSTFALAFGKPVVLTNDLVVVEATAASACSPIRLIPVVGVTTGAHYRMSTGHSSPALAHVARGDPVKARQHCSQQGNLVGVNNKLLTINY